jgi:hypothetical protein
MYCSIEDVRRLLPPTITIGNQNLGTPSPGSPITKRDQLTPAEVIQFIRFAQQEIDSRLRPFYSCPLRRIKLLETGISENVSSGTSVSVKVWDALIFAVGDEVRLQNRDEMELSTITSISNETTLVLNSVVNNYMVEGSKISIVKFPDPIPFTTARLAVSYAFDQLFNAQQSPDVSEYGKEQRRLATNSLDNILSGSIMLTGQELTGRRFLRGTLLDAWDSPVKEFQFGREKA